MLYLGQHPRHMAQGANKDILSPFACTGQENHRCSISPAHSELAHRQIHLHLRSLRMSPQEMTPHRHSVLFPLSLCSKSHGSFKAFCAFAGAHLSINPLSPPPCMNCLLALGQHHFAWRLQTSLLPCWRTLLLQKIQLNSTLLICLSTATQQRVGAFCAG